MPVGSNPQSVSENLPPGALGRLTWEEGGTPHERLITNKGLTIGRSSQNDLAVTDLAASRFHCKILPESNGQIQPPAPTLPEIGCVTKTAAPGTPPGSGDGSYF